MANLFGTGINQVPTNGMLGSLAFQDKAYVAVDAIGIGTTFVDSGTASQPLQVAGGGYFSGSVGIGTTNPSAKLDVYGTSRFGGTTSAGRRVDITTDGVVTLAYGNNANASNLILQNAGDVGSTTNHGNSILWQFGTSTTTVPIDAGEVKIAKELQWTTTATTQDAYFSISLALNGTVGEKLRVTSSGNLGIGTTNPSSQLHITGQFQSTQANSATTGGGQIYLNGANGNRIDFSTAGVAAPAFTTRSAGTKLVLYPSVGASKVDYAFGINTNLLWSSVEDSGSQFKWYAGTTNIASLFGTGELVLGTTSLTGTASQPLQVTGSAYVSGNVGIGTTNPAALLHLSSGANTTLRLTDTAGSYSDIIYNESGSVSTLILDADPTNSSVPGTAIIMKTDGSECLRVDALGRLLVGTSTARVFDSSTSTLTPLTQIESTGSESAFSIVRNNAASTGPGLFFGKSRSGANGGTTVVQIEDRLGTIFFEGTDGTNLIEAASIFAQVDGTPGTNDMPGRLVFATTADGASSPSEQMRITSAGNVGIGTTNPSDKLHVLGGNIRVDSTTGGLQFWSGAGFYGGIGVAGGMGGSGTDIAIRADSTRSIIFFTGGINDRGRFDASGNLLLGTSTSTGTASQPLQVNGGAYVSENLVIGTSGKLLVGALGTAALPIISFLNDPNTGLFSPGADQVAISTGGTAKFTVGSLDGNPIIENNFPTVRPALDLAFAATKRLDPRVTFVRATSATYVGGDGLVKTAGVNEARFDHNPTTRESLGLLVEEARTNSFLYSEQFDNGNWVKASTNLAVTSNATTAPDGTLTADKYTEGSGLVYSFTFQSVSPITASTSYTQSYFAKFAGRQWVFICCYLNGEGYVSGAYFDIVNGVIGNVSAGVSATIVNFGNGWFKCNATATSNSTVANYNGLQMTSANGVNPILTGYTGDGTSGIFIWGAQLEAGAFPTSYIPTTSATVTRAADVASVTGTNFSSWYNQTEGTVFAAGVSNGANGAGFFTLEDGSAAEYIRMGTGFSLLNAVVSKASGTQADIYSTGTSFVFGSPFRGVAAYAFNNVGISLNGGSAQVDTAADMPSAANVLRIGFGKYGTYTNGTIRRLTYWPVRLPNATLQSLTS